MDLPDATPKQPSLPRMSEWEKHREIINQLYIQEDKTLKEVWDILTTQHDLALSKKQLEHLITQWGLRKNLTADEYREIYRRIQIRAKEGKATAVYVGGVAIPPTRLNRNIQRNIGITDKARLSSVYWPTMDLPQDISLVTPPQSPNSVNDTQSHSRAPVIEHSGFRPPAPSATISGSSYNGFQTRQPSKWFCKGCDLPFNNGKIYGRHMKNLHAEKPFFCEYCGITFVRPDYKKAHLSVCKAFLKTVPGTRSRSPPARELSNALKRSLANTSSSRSPSHDPLYRRVNIRDLDNQPTESQVLSLTSPPLSRQSGASETLPINPNPGDTSQPRFVSLRDLDQDSQPIDVEPQASSLIHPLPPSSARFSGIESSENSNFIGNNDTRSTHKPDNTPAADSPSQRSSKRLRTNGDLNSKLELVEMQSKIWRDECMALKEENVQLRTENTMLRRLVESLRSADAGSEHGSAPVNNINPNSP
ncbi:hypothetical protein TWF694_010130 [Orbilia ellipsospora]|uniref:C2H2-type domain-containing protein n=1 Tax=Orbilia ellipsospora TaxID=2528407 RepID=A0AAV9XAB8_9PEZI